MSCCTVNDDETEGAGNEEDIALHDDASEREGCRGGGSATSVEDDDGEMAGLAR